MSLGLGRFDGHLFSPGKTLKASPLWMSINGSPEVKPLSLAEKFSRIVDSATGDSPFVKFICLNCLWLCRSEENVPFVCYGKVS